MFFHVFLINICNFSYADCFPDCIYIYYFITRAFLKYNDGTSARETHHRPTI